MNYFFGSAYSLITNIGSFLLSFIIFMTCLFYFVESKVCCTVYQLLLTLPRLGSVLEVHR